MPKHTDKVKCSGAKICKDKKCLGTKLHESGWLCTGKRYCPNIGKQIQCLPARKRKKVKPQPPGKTRSRK